MMDWTDDGIWMNGWGMLFMVVFWAAVLGLVIWAVIRTTGATQADGRRESPKQILDRRLASGELTPDEYVAASDLLTHGERDRGAPPA